MISLFSIFLQLSLAEILIQNLVNTTKGIQNTPLNSFCENLLPQNKLKISLTQESQETLILAICQNQLENNQNFEQLLDSPNNLSNNCLLDYNAYKLRNKTQIIFLSHKEYPTLVQYFQNTAVYHNITKFFKLNKINVMQLFIHLLILCTFQQLNLSRWMNVQSKCNNYLRDCKNEGVCVKGFCQCSLGFVGYDCSLAATNIEQNTQFFGFQIQYLDLITLQSVDYIIELNSEISYSIQCYSNSSHLFILNQTGKTLQINENEIHLCKQQIQLLEQITQLNYYSQFIFVTNTSTIVQYFGYNNEQPSSIIVIIILTTILSVIIILIIVVYILRRKSSYKQQSNINQIDNFMPAQLFLSVTDRKQPCKEEKFCSICLEPFKPKCKIRITYCEHIFHVNCLENWMKKNKICPLCRASLDTITIQSKKQNVLNPQKSHILQQLSLQQKNDGSLTSIDGNLTYHSPVTKQLALVKHSKFLK